MTEITREIVEEELRKRNFHGIPDLDEGISSEDILVSFEDILVALKIYDKVTPKFKIAEQYQRENRLVIYFSCHIKLLIFYGTGNMTIHPHAQFHNLNFYFSADQIAEVIACLVYCSYAIKIGVEASIPKKDFYNVLYQDQSTDKVAEFYIE